MSLPKIPVGPRSEPRRRGPARCVALAIGWLTLIASLAHADPDPEPIDLALYERLLETHTRAVPELVGTRVDYRGLRDSKDWEQLVAQVSAARPAQLERNARLAFWINAYNILTIDLVLEHYPVESIKDIGSFLFPVWDKRVATIDGRDVTLGEIEHEILRPMGEPRIHAAIVCASTSCPSLSREPFRAARLDEDLSTAMRAWLASSEKGVAIDRPRRIVTLSRIFKWFGEDFEASGGILSTIARYVDAQDAAWLRSEGQRASIRYFDYDWSLNDLTVKR